MPSLGTVKVGQGHSTFIQNCHNSDNPNPSSGNSRLFAIDIKQSFLRISQIVIKRTKVRWTEFWGVLQGTQASIHL